MQPIEKKIETAITVDALSHISTHNAYHIGQMVFVRKLQGAWEPEKGVK